MKTRLLIIGGILIILGVSFASILSVYSLFTSIPIMILGFYIICNGSENYNLSCSISNLIAMEEAHDRNAKNELGKFYYSANKIRFCINEHICR